MPSHTAKKMGGPKKTPGGGNSVSSKQSSKSKASGNTRTSSGNQPPAVITTGPNNQPLDYSLDAFQPSMRHVLENIIGMGDCKKCIIMALKALGATDDPGDLFIDDTQLSSLQYMDEHGALVSINATASGALKSFKRWIQSLVAQGSFTDWLSLSPQDYGLFRISAQNQIQPNVVPPPSMTLS